MKCWYRTDPEEAWTKGEIRQQATSPDIFTPDEGRAYLKLPSLRSFNNVRRRYKIRGARVGNEMRYSRRQLEYIRASMFGEEKR